VDCSAHNGKPRNLPGQCGAVLRLTKSHTNVIAPPRLLHPPPAYFRQAPAKARGSTGWRVVRLCPALQDSNTSAADTSEPALKITAAFTNCFTGLLRLRPRRCMLILGPGGTWADANLKVRSALVVIEQERFFSVSKGIRIDLKKAGQSHPFGFLGDAFRNEKAEASAANHIPRPRCCFRYASFVRAYLSGRDRPGSAGTSTL